MRRRVDSHRQSSTQAEVRTENSRMLCLSGFARAALEAATRLTAAWKTGEEGFSSSEQMMCVVWGVEGGGSKGVRRGRGSLSLRRVHRC